MNEIIDFLFSQYSSYSESFIFLESFAVGMNILSVIYAKQNNILVYTYTCKNNNILLFMNEFNVDGIVTNYKISNV